MSDYILRGEVRYQHLYHCSSCGFSQPGEILRIEADQLHTVRRSGHGMPVGWSSRYGTPVDIFICPNCNKD